MRLCLDCHVATFVAPRNDDWVGTPTPDVESSICHSEERSDVGIQRSVTRLAPWPTRHNFRCVLAMTSDICGAFCFLLAKLRIYAKICAEATPTRKCAYCREPRLIFALLPRREFVLSVQARIKTQTAVSPNYLLGGVPNGTFFLLILRWSNINTQAEDFFFSDCHSERQRGNPAAGAFASLDSRGHIRSLRMTYGRFDFST